MDFEKDYYMRMINDMVRFLVRLITGKSQSQYEIKNIEHPTLCDDTYARIIAMANAGQINDAENILYEKLNPTDQDYLLMGLSFYTHLNEFKDDFLTLHSYSREEIQEGIENLAKEFGVRGVELFSQSFKPM